MDHFGKNSGTALIIFLKFCTMKRANRWEKIILMVFTKKNLFRTNVSFWARKWHIS